MRFQKSLLGTAAILYAIGLAQPGDALAQGQPVKGGQVIVGIGGDPPVVNPDVTTGIPDQFTGCLVYEGLIRVKVDSTIDPMLATKWSVSPDGKTYTFDLRAAKWQDGQNFTSEDVKHSLTEVSAKFASVFSSAAKVLDRIETPAPDKVVVHLKEPFGPFLMSLACQQGGAIMPAHLFRGKDVLTNPATTQSPMGTGPFKLAEWKRGDYLKFTRNATYWDPNKPYLDEIVAKVLPQAGARTQALLGGEVDFVTGYYIQPNDYSTIRANANLKVQPSGFPPSANNLFFNVLRKPLDDKKVRQALTMATDREYLLRTAWFGVGEVGTSPISTMIQWTANPNVDYRKMYPFDYAKANALLDEAGYKRGADGKRFPLRIVIASDAADLAQVSQGLKGMWANVGVDVSIESLERASRGKKVFEERDFDVTMIGYTSYGDPALGVARTFISAQIGKPFGNLSSYSNAKVDELFDKGAGATSLEERGKFYQEAQAIIAADQPTITLQQYITQDTSSKKLNGVWGYQGYGAWDNAWMAK